MPHTRSGLDAKRTLRGHGQRGDERDPVSVGVGGVSDSPRSMSQARQLQGIHDAPRTRASGALLQRCAVPVAQRTFTDAELYGPTEAQALSPNFRDHHSTRGAALTDGIAIGNHESRARDGPNTSLEMDRGEAQYELMVYLQALNVEQSEALEEENHIYFRTNAAYKFACTAWNGGDPQVDARGEAAHDIGAELRDGGDGESYFRVFHYGPP